MEKSDFGLSYLCLTENVSSDVEHLALFSHDFACLQETILIWIPCGFLLCMLPFQIYQLISSNVKRIGWTTLNLLKTIVTSCLILLSVSNCVYRIHQWKYLGVEVSHAQYAAPFILTLALCLALVFIELDRRKGIQSSAILFCFWLLLVVAGFLAYIANLIDLINHSYIKELFSFAFCMIYYPLVCGEFVLACYKDIPTWTVVSEDKNVCPDQQAGFLSVLLFWWFNKLIWKGYKNPIVKEDLWVLNNDNLTGTTSSVFEYHWKKKENLGKKRGLWHLIWTLIRGFGLSYLVTFFLRAGAETIPFIQPFILKLLIQYIENKGEEEWRGYAYTIVLFLLSLVNTLLLQQYYYKCLVTGMKIKSAVISAVFRKSLRLSNAAKKSSTTGEIVNLMSVDAQRFIDAMLYFNLVWTTPVQILITLYFLYTILGISVVAGIAVIGTLLTCNGIIVSKWAFFENEEMNEKDKRMKVINEVLNGIKVLKLYAWEIPFEKVISDLREKELTFRKYLVYMLASATVSWMCTPFLVSLACYIMFIFYANGILSPQIAFVSLSFFNLLRFPLFMLPEVVSVMIQLRVSLKRLATFLSNDELDPDNVVNEFKKGVALEIENGSFSWDKEKNIILNNINMVVNEGQLVAIVGQVGSGKSSLISACLGEMEKVSGKVSVENKTAYVPQQAWIQNNTLRGNILFNKFYRENKYNSVIEACALTADLEVLPGGDKTEIGEKGINLSGGQKQRISLARAVYSNADVYFLDDPLSAVDAHVGKHIFDCVIGPSGLLKDKTRIFATNAVSYLPYVDLIIVIVKGTISEVGSYQELMTQNGAFSEFLQNYLISGSNSTGNEEVAEKNIDIIEDVMTSCEGLDRSPSMRILNRGISVVSVDKSQKDLDSPKNQSRLIEDEILETGDVKLRVYLLYLKYATYFLISLVCIFTLVASAFNIASTIWLKEWSADPTFNSSSFTEINIKTRDLRLIVYACLGIGQGIFTLLYYMMLGIAFISASRTLHKQLLKNILKSPMHFFDTTPLGRIVNRFGKDIDYVDHYITRNIDEILYFGVQVLSIIFVISYSTPIFMVVLVPLGIVYYFIQRFYIITSRQLKRLESISRSPIYSHFQESLAGVVTIRAYKQDERFITESESRVDANHSAFFTSIASNRWLSVRLEFVGNCVVFFAALFAVLSRDVIDPGVMGLSISYALMLTQGMSWMVIVACELETNIVAVERIQDYSEGVTEADWVIENNRPSKQWPGNGRVSFENYQTRYRPGLDLVLKGINCNIIPGEKIGIAGRTGAGKSSLTLALFRIIEATSGSISIDDIDISKIGLHDLRSKLTIIPQDPVLFSGTLRMNLDPFNNNNDDELWTALEQSHLKNFVNSLTLGLQHEISEGGENLSVGQRQLVCLARALLRKTKVLILDEATAAIDLETDDLIQNTIRKEFKDCTILTIAHRLNTIMDSDRVMVLDQGVIKEFDTPSQLLLDTGSIFYMMSKDAGLLSENHKE